MRVILYVLTYIVSISDQHCRPLPTAFDYLYIRTTDWTHQPINCSFSKGTYTHNHITESFTFLKPRVDIVLLASGYWNVGLTGSTGRRRALLLACCVIQAAASGHIQTCLILVPIPSPLVRSYPEHMLYTHLRGNLNSPDASNTSVRH